MLVLPLVHTLFKMYCMFSRDYGKSHFQNLSVYGRMVVITMEISYHEVIWYEFNVSYKYDVGIKGNNIT